MKASTAVVGTEKPQELPQAFMQAFNRGDFDAIERLFDAEAVRVLSDAKLCRGSDRLVPTRNLYESGARLDLNLNACFISDGVALLLTRSAIIATSGKISVGTAIDVARRTAEGSWAYLIDNPLAVGLSQF